MTRRMNVVQILAAVGDNDLMVYIVNSDGTETWVRDGNRDATGVYLMFGEFGDGVSARWPNSTTFDVRIVRL